MPYQSRLPGIADSLASRVDRALQASAELVTVQAKARVPVRTGRLQRAIHVEKTPFGRAVVAGDREAFYGHFVEFGTHRTAAEPFLIPALEASREPIGMIAHDALRDL